MENLKRLKGEGEDGDEQHAHVSRLRALAKEAEPLLEAYAHALSAVVIAVHLAPGHVYLTLEAPGGIPSQRALDLMAELSNTVQRFCAKDAGEEPALLVDGGSLISASLDADGELKLKGEGEPYASQ